jgi:hypothetical protein
LDQLKLKAAKEEFSKMLRGDLLFFQLLDKPIPHSP